MSFFGYAIVAGLLSLWFWWLERRRAASVTRLAASAKTRVAAADEDEDEDEDDDDVDYERRRRLLRAARFPVHGAAVVLAWVAAICFVLSWFRTVPSGTAGVPVTFGKASGQVGPGLHVEWPITKMRSISVRTQSYTMAVNGDDPSVQVLGQDGTVATADATLLFRVSRDKATNLYDNVGTGYVTTVVKPTARTCVRAAFTTRPMIEAATTQFATIEKNINACIHDKFEGKGITVQDFQLRELVLSSQLQNAIDGQIAAKMLGVNTVDPRYLQYYYIQALLQFAKSSNNSIVISPPGTQIAIPAPGGTTPTTLAPTTTTASPIPGR